jgi:hypothetical protein
MFEPEQDFIPGYDVFRRLVEALAKLPSIHSLQSREVSDHRMILVKDTNGEILARRLVKLQHVVPLQPPWRSRYTVTDSCLPQSGCETPISTEHPVSYDLRRLHPLLSAEAPLLTSLKGLYLTVPRPLLDNPPAFQA